MDGTAQSSTATTPRKSRGKLGGLFSCWGRLTLRFPWLKIRRGAGKHYKSLTGSGKLDCKSLASVAVAPKQPRPVGEFGYDPMSYSQNFDEGCWYDDVEGYAIRGFPSRFASLPSRPLPVNPTTTTTATTTSSNWN